MLLSALATILLWQMPLGWQVGLQGGLRGEAGTASRQAQADPAWANCPPQDMLSPAATMKATWGKAA